MLRRRRRRDERGVALTEAVFVLPVLLMITLAVTEFGFYFSSSSTTIAASRDGARYATAFYATRADKLAVGDEIRGQVEGDLESLTGQGNPVQLWIYKATASGEPIGGLECTTDCMRYSWDGSEFVFQPGSSDIWTVVDACPTATSPEVDDIGVMVEVRHDLLTGVIGSGNRVIRERTVLRLEPLPSTQCPA